MLEHETLYLSFLPSEEELRKELERRLLLEDN